MKEKETEEITENPLDKSTEMQIAEFAAKLGEEIGSNYTVYIYRIVKDEITGKMKHPFILKLIGQEPDPLEIAERYRAGAYKIQFIWKDSKKKQQGKSYTLDIDSEAFPPLPKGSSLVPMAGGSNLSEPMQLQLVMIQSISEVLKAAYTSENSNGRNNHHNDPLDQFSGMMEAMETAYGRAMQIQQKVMERVLTKGMESKFGLSPDDVSSIDGVTVPEETGISKYAPLVRECVDGLKSLVGMFGDNVPKGVVEKVRGNGRFKTLLEDKQALVVIGQALRREFGDDRAARLMNAFGVKMVLRASPGTPPVVKTPSIPSMAAASTIPTAAGRKAAGKTAEMVRIDSRRPEAGKKIRGV